MVPPADVPMTLVYKDSETHQQLHEDDVDHVHVGDLEHDKKEEK